MTNKEFNTLSEKYKIISITADFITTFYDSVQAKRLDNSRHIICSLTENGIPRSVRSDETARVRIQKPDKTYVYNDCDVVDGSVLITLTEQILACPGTASCDIQLTSYDGVIYSTKKFYIVIDDTPYPPDAIESSNEFNALNKIIAQEKEHIDLIKELDNTLTTNESVRQANEDTRKNNEDIREHNEDVRLSSERNRVDAENLRVNNETTRIKAENTREANENTRINSEDTRHDNENTRISNENERISTEIIRNTTEISRNNNETKRVSSENERLKKEDARISAETNRVTNESIRIANEEKRIDSETKRQSDHSILQNQFDTAISNTNIATDNAKKATTDAKKATQLAENATDLALEAAANANDTYAYSTKYTDEKISNLVNGAPETLDTLKEVADAIAENETVVKALDSAIGTKANQSVLNNHTSNSTIHITSAERTSWNSKASGTHAHNYAGSSSAGGAATTSLACTGNAATATKLATARTINGVSFDGSTNITIPDTKNTAGATNTTSKMYLLGAKEQSTSPQSYSNSNAYIENNILYLPKGINVGSDMLTVSSNGGISIDGDFVLQDGTLLEERLNEKSPIQRIRCNYGTTIKITSPCTTSGACSSFLDMILFYMFPYGYGPIISIPYCTPGGASYNLGWKYMTGESFMTYMSLNTSVFLGNGVFIVTITRNSGFNNNYYMEIQCGSQTKVTIS